MVEFEDVSFVYQGTNTPALKNCSFQIGDGETILLCGRSGSGKTTVTKLINGLIPHFFEGELTGNVTVNGMDVRNTPMWQLAGTVASVFQNPKSQFFNMDTTNEIVFGMENLGIPREEMRRRLPILAAQCGVENLLDRGIFELSGGEKQRIAIASAMAVGTDIVLLDEPTSNLDIENILKVRELVSTLRKSGKTIIIAEHRLWPFADQIDRAFYFCDNELSQIYTRDDFLALDEATRKKSGLRRIVRQQTNIEKVSCAADQEDVFLVEGLAAAYGKHKVWKNVGFAVRKGEIVAITGDNGAGKTTLAECLCGIKKEKSGRIFLNGKALTARERRKKCFLIMQNVNNQLFSDSVIGEVMLGGCVEKTRAMSVLEELNLTAFSEKHPMALSGGQKQRLAIADGCICDKEVLIFDEPTSGLDLEHMERVSEIMKQLAGQGKYVILITHDEEFIEKTNAKVIRWQNSFF